ncbi:MAG TPA: tetratricopeptide repeat protein [Thermoanaerobaculia bacterium]|nr:tetratricopeptide repeat protein [Thermoanaerobaculia bacterium]
MSWERLFDDLVDLSPADQQARLAELEAKEPALARRLRVLLAADSLPDSFLEQPIADITTSIGLGRPATGRDSHLPPGTLVGAWRLGARIGHGGMGEVYLAERADGAFEQRVALKLIKRGMDTDEIVRRFLTERQILARLDHPGIARLLDGGSTSDGRPYFVMEHVEGEPLLAWCARQGLSLAERVRLMVRVAQAVDSAHRRLVVHRDLKPSNLLLTADGQVKLLDFGIAKLLGEEAGTLATRIEARALTPAYAAPEQILGEAVTTATDVYALGVMLYQLVAGRLPFRRSHRALPLLMSEIDEQAAQRASTVVRRLKPEEAREVGIADPPRFARLLEGDLDTILARALQRDPARRYRSAVAFAEDLERYLDGRPIQARPDSMAYRLRKWIGRHRFAAVAALLVVAALAIGVGVAWWQFGVARDQARRADQQAARAEKEARRAERVKAFLISIFQQSDPYQNRGGTVTARQVLEEGARRVESELEAEPEVQAELFAAISTIEANLGLVEPALEHAGKAVALSERLAGSEGLQLGRSLGALGLAHQTAGRRQEAEAAFTRSLEALERSLGPDHLEVAEVKSNLIEAMKTDANRDRLLTLQREVYESYRKVAGEEDPRTALHLQNLAVALEEAGRYPEAKDAYRRAVTALEGILGRQHLDTAMAHVSYAGLLDRLGETAAAEEHFRLGIATQREVLGPRHPKLAGSLFSLGVLHLVQERFAEAETSFTDALAIFGPGRLETGHCHRYLGLVRLGQERWGEAVTELEAAVAAYRTGAPAGNVQVWRATANLGYARARMGQLAEGERLLRLALAEIARTLGPRSYDERTPSRQLGEVLLLAGRFGEAEAVLRETLDLEVELFGSRRHRNSSATFHKLALAVLGGGRDGARSEARSLLDEGLAITGAEPTPSTIGAELLLASGRLAAQDGQLERARRELAAARDAFQGLKGAEHPLTREAADALARLGGRR